MDPGSLNVSRYFCSRPVQKEGFSFAGDFPIFRAYYARFPLWRIGWFHCVASMFVQKPNFNYSPALLVLGKRIGSYVPIVRRP